MRYRRAWLLVVLLIVLAGVAEARVGGGQGFSNGSSGGGGSGGDADVVFDIFFLLLHLCIEYPAIGLPLMAIFLMMLLIRAIGSHDFGRVVVENHSVSNAPAEVSQSARQALLKQDAAFSETVFLDFAALVHRRALAAHGDFSLLGPFVHRELQRALKPLDWVEEVIIGAVTLEAIKAKDPQVLRVGFTALYLNGDRRELVQSTWTFERQQGALSLPPEQTLSLSCPSCGNPAETTPLGACVSCGTPNTQGQLQWQAVWMKLRSHGPAPRPQLALNLGGIEASANEPTRQQPQLAVQLRRLTGRHPDFRKQAFKERVEVVYLAIQEAWSANAWDRARPFVTDTLYQQLRFWIDDYARNGLRNQLDDVRLDTTQIVKVEVDAWYESITVRIWGRIKDSVVDESGAVVAGNTQEDRVFSEYWTFLRAAGTGAATSDPTQCPSCGAPLDKIGSNGVCGYCGSKISTGRFDWVLSRIEQPEVYRG